ncbi:MAG: hypothetical protein CVV48_04605 [Spirochaetae bacterium HGW-Spirochaetae-4]|jgi:hypothetical protein|nr:MAG: hypothetical protein CVV48_04605 [Spirochaetae bacterium HGW-Spirochaetae-4]
MGTIRKYKAAVFYVDILGMGALTKEEISLTTSDYQSWLKKYRHEFSHQYLAAAILAEFRQILSSLIIKYDNVVISQLSDCAFIWSDDICNIIKFAAEFMQLALGKGVFCRAGLTYGEIIETNENHTLVRFIVGPAVTTAVKLEKIAKGARILIDEDFPKFLWNCNKIFAERTQPLFSPFTNPLDYEVYDEFKWYLVPSGIIGEVDLRMLVYYDKVEFTKNRLKLANRVRLSPKFLWNTKSIQGRIQLKATVSFMAENKLLGIRHDYAWTGLGIKRSKEIVDNLERQITNDNNFQEFSTLQSDTIIDDDY